MTKLWLGLWLFWIVAELKAQVLWAVEVLSYSSYYDNGKKNQQYRPVQALGKPNVWPDGRLSPCAWTPATPDARANEWIHVRFEKPLNANRIVIAENFGAGCITHIYAYNTAGEELLVYRNIKNLQTPPPKSRFFNVPISVPYFFIESVKVVLSTVDVPGWNQIDAIGIAQSAEPIKMTFPQIPDPGKVEIEALGPEINSPAEEILPVISADGKTLYFDRKNHPENTESHTDNDDIWFAQAKGDGFGPAQNIGPPLNTHGHNFVCSVSPDGNTLVLGNRYLGDGSTTAGVSISRRTATGWSKPIPLTIADFYNNNPYGEYYMATSGKVLLMAVERRDSYGDRDIYVSFLKSDSTWTAPKNLGPTINTADMEITPFLAADGKTLFFASAGRAGYGKVDIFVSKRLDMSWEKWSEPQNLGPSFNSSQWDASYTLDAKGQYVYFVSYRNGSADIFRAVLPESVRPEPVAIIEGIVLNAKDNRPLEAQISYELVPTGEEVGIANSDPKNGKYQIALPPGKKYLFFAYATGYFSEAKEIDLTQAETYSEHKINLRLIPIEPGTKVTLRDIYFQQGTPQLLAESYSELRRLGQVMRRMPHLKVRIIGHTDKEGVEELNLQLSQQRSEAVKKYLLSLKIDPSRIETIGKGSSELITHDRDEESKQLNRRVEIEVLSY